MTKNKNRKKNISNRERNTQQWALNIRRSQHKARACGRGRRRRRPHHALTSLTRVIEGSDNNAICIPLHTHHMLGCGTLSKRGIHYQLPLFIPVALIHAAKDVAHYPIHWPPPSPLPSLPHPYGVPVLCKGGFHYQGILYGIQSQHLPLTQHLS